MANGNGKKSKKKLIVLSAIGVVVLVLIALVFLGNNKETIITVQTEPVQRRTITQIVSATGKIQPEIQVKINAEVSGEIVELAIREGQRVNKGQLLVRIKPDAYQAQYERAQASLAKAESEYRRAAELYEKKLVSEAEMEVAKANYQSAKATYKEANETLTKTIIYSPMNGVVSQLKSEIGERVSGSTFTQGTEMMTIADLSRMEARVDVGENDVVMVGVGDTARIEVDAYPDRKFVGLVSKIANTAKSTGLGTQDQVTNFEVRILVDSPSDVQFRPGMSMTADIETETRKDVFSVPIQSVTVRVPKKPEGMEGPKDGEAVLAATSKKKEEDKLDEVIFVADGGTAKTVVVKRGLSDDTYVEVKGDSLEGREVVSGPFKAINRDLENESKVKVDNKTARKTGATVAENK